MRNQMKKYNIVRRGNDVRVFTDAELEMLRCPPIKIGKINAEKKQDVIEKIFGAIKVVCDA